MISSVKDLYLQNVERKKQSHQIYKTMYTDVMHKIQEKHTKYIYNLLYNPPTFVFGNLKYNKKTCIVYLVKKLSDRGFVVFPYNQNTLYIDWSYIQSISPTQDKETNEQKSGPKRVTFDPNISVSSVPSSDEIGPYRRTGF
jgi:hypothetical protein